MASSKVTITWTKSATADVTAQKLYAGKDEHGSDAKEVTLGTALKKDDQAASPTLAEIQTAVSDATADMDGLYIAVSAINAGGETKSDFVKVAAAKVDPPKAPTGAAGQWAA